MEWKKHNPDTRKGVSMKKDSIPASTECAMNARCCGFLLPAAKVEEFLQGVGPVDPVLAEQGLIDGVGPGHGLGVGFGGPAPLDGAAGLEDNHRFFRLP